MVPFRTLHKKRFYLKTINIFLNQLEVSSDSDVFEIFVECGMQDPNADKCQVHTSSGMAYQILSKFKIQSLKSHI